MKALWRLVPVTAALLWLACETTTTNTDDEPVTPLPEVGLFTYDYTRAGDSLTLAVDTAYCAGATLVRDTLTVTAVATVEAESLLTLTLTSRFPGGAPFLC